MQNNLTRLRRNESFSLNPRIIIQEYRRNVVQGRRIVNDVTNEEFRYMEVRVPNPDVIVLEEIFEYEITNNQEDNFIQEETLESVQMDECKSSMYIFNDHEEVDISQDNVVQTRAQENKSKIRENLEKVKEKENV
jgi:hypothetical protein